MAKDLNKRLKTIEVLLAGGPSAGWAELPGLKREVGAIGSAERVQGPRQGLVSILHTTRLLDSTLRRLLDHHAIPQPASPALGPYLRSLVTHHAPGVGQLPAARRTHYDRTIVRVRNRALHQADDYPSKVVARAVLGEMHACLLEVLDL